MKYLISFALILLTIISCEEVVDLEIDSDETRLIVEGRITNELKVHQIKLTETSDFFNPAEPVSVVGATVTVTDGSNEIQFVESSPGIYGSPVFAGEVGKTYELSIILASALANETVFSAQSTMLNPVVLDSLSAFNSIDFSDGDEFLFTALNFWGTGNLEQENAYLMEVFVNEQLETDTINEVVVFKDEFLNENFEDFNFFFIEEPAALVGDSITLLMHTVEEDFADFHNELLIESEPRDPFGLSSPPSNVSTNISGSAIGYFYTSSVDTVYTRVIDDF